MSVETALAEARAVCLAEVEQLRALRRDVEREHEEFVRAAAQEAHARAARARAGDHGTAAQRLQQRLDAGDTTPEAIRNGLDGDPSAEAGRRCWQETLDAWASAPEVHLLRHQRMEPGEYAAAAGYCEARSAISRHTDWV